MRRSLVPGLVAVVTLVGGPASAETRVRGSHDRERPPAGSTLGFGSASPGARLDRVSLSVRGSRATAVLTLSTTASTPKDTSLLVDVPAGAEVTYLGLRLAGTRRIAQLANAASAHATYAEIVEDKIDPALLEWVESTETTDRLRLRVYPLVRGKTAEVELIMTLPPSTSLVLDPGTRTIGRVELDIDGRQLATKLTSPRRIPLVPEALGEAAQGAPHVDRQTSLFIDMPFDRPTREELVRAAVQERRGPPRGAIKIAKECLDNPLAPSCM